jgi:hypothetical protein
MGAASWGASHQRTPAHGRDRDGTAIRDDSPPFHGGSPVALQPSAVKSPSLSSALDRDGPPLRAEPRPMDQRLIARHPGLPRAHQLSPRCCPVRYRCPLRRGSPVDAMPSQGEASARGRMAVVSPSGDGINAESGL